jgi:putative membrane protein
MKCSGNKMYGFMLAATMVVAASCNENTQNKMADNVDTVKDKVESKIDDVKDDMKQKKDENFVSDVVKANSQELHLLHLATTKGTSKDVKAAAKKMIPDHESMGKDMGTYATNKGIKADVDSSDLKSDLDDQKAGADWDMAWVNKMVDDHQKMVDKFQNAQNDVNDPELKKMITETIPTLQKHLMMSQELQTKMKNK